MAAAHHAELCAKEAAFGEQVSTLQKELDQLHASAGHMKLHLEAAQQSQIDAQAEASRLQLELQGLQFSTAQAEKQSQGDTPSLQGQLEIALAASDQEISSLRGQLKTILADSDMQINDVKVAAADSDRRLNVMKGQLETAQAEYAKASQVEGRLDMALKNSKNAHQQRDSAFKARRAAEERETRVSYQLRLAQVALGRREADRQDLISQHAADLEQQGHRVEALQKQLQKLQDVERASRQEVETLSRQLYLKRPQTRTLT
ncbi:hypothetical protein WJX79_007675 [Trebouxia sp. C0005]